MKNIRLILILLIGGLLTHFVFQSQFKTFFFDSIIELGLAIIGIIIFIWTITTDFKIYKVEKKIKNFALTILCLMISFLCMTFHILTINKFNKQTLLKVYYDGDINGTGIDFKTDGTYIFENSAMGLSDYFYGKYKIIENKITLDKDKFDNLTNLKYLEIRESKIENNPTELYLYQIDSLGNLFDNSDKFRVTIDNRINIKKK